MGAELLELRAHFGVSATEALKEMPSWEYDLLVGALAEEPGEPTDQDTTDPEPEPAEPAVPEALKGL